MTSTTTATHDHRPTRGPLDGQLGTRLRALLDRLRTDGLHLHLDVQPHGHGALITVQVDGQPAFGPVAPELAEAFLRGWAACLLRPR